MAEIQLIVEKLNGPPFNKAFTLVGFDEKSSNPTELLQLLNDVLAELDKAHRVDARDEPPDAAGFRIVSFLQLLKFPLPADPTAFTASIGKGERSAVYPVLAFVLAKLPMLKKRAYVARYLLPLEVPPEFTHEEAVAEALAQYRMLQSEFKETHKALDKAAGAASASGKPAPSELRKEIAQLESERGQLLDKVAGLKKRTAEIPGFAPLLEATSSLRREQEEEGRLAERMHEQRLELAAAERKYADANRRLAEARAAAGKHDDSTPEAMLEAARTAAAESRHLAKKALPASITARRETLAKLQRMLAEPTKTEDDLLALRGAVASLEETVAVLTAETAAMQRAAGDDKLAMYRQQAALVAKKVTQREEALEVVAREMEALAREIEGKEAKLSEMSGPRHMSREEFAAYAAALRAKTQTYKGLKQELADVRQETVVLARTEALLKARAGDIDVFLRKLEEKKGVSGYTAVQSEMEAVSALKQRIDESKGATLNEISRIVDDINALVRDKRAQLQPAIKELRTRRAEFSEVEAVYLRDKAVYESVASGLEGERAALEREADALQEDALREESRFHVLTTQLEGVTAALDRAKSEADCEKGSDRYLRDFKTRKDLYGTKLGQLETLAKELRKKQKDIRENAAAHAAQRARFGDLHKLLQAKATVYRIDPTGGYSGVPAVEAMLAAAARGGDGTAAGGAGAAGGAAAGGVGFEDTGGANVMILDQ